MICLENNVVSWLQNVRYELDAPAPQEASIGEPHPLLGYLLEGAKVGKLLGVGSFAVVFELDDPQGGQLAVKVLRRSTISKHSEQENESFRREVDIGMRLEHPSITRIHRFAEKARTRFVVLDRIEGRTLASLMDEPLSPDGYRALFAPLATGLAYAHSMGVIHRDLKPENVMVANDSAIKILDFGLARSASSRDVTLTGEFKGTPKYCAPEQACDSKKVGPHSDQFAFGLLSFQMLTGHFPYPEYPKQPLQTIWARLQQPAAKLSSVWSEASPEADDAMARMLATKPEDRFGSVEEAYSALSLALPEGSCPDLALALC